MMRAPTAVAVAVRAMDGTIRTTTWRVRSATQRTGVLGAPFVRGCLSLVDSLTQGIRALTWSGEQFEQEGAPSTSDRWAVAITAGVSLIGGIGLFVAVPHLLTAGLGLVPRVDLPGDGIAFQLIDGGLKLAIFVGYLALIARMPDIQRMFAYHGAEHMVIDAWERQGDGVTVAEARHSSRYHARCGTSFLLIVVVTSIAVFVPVFALLPPLAEHSGLDHLLRMVTKTALMLPVAGVAYELMRLVAARQDQPLFSRLARPGMWLQGLTTAPPDDDQLEVALTALQTALRVHGGSQEHSSGLERAG